jgi:hypothetical protein
VPDGALGLEQQLAAADGVLERAAGAGLRRPVDAALYPTLGPENRFSTLLYIEKEGFEPLLRAAGIPERFDCAIMSTKGCR